MTDIHIERPHQLGLARARELAQQWQLEAKDEYGMTCRHEPGETEDQIHFERMGVKGLMKVSAEHFCVDIHLGFLLGAYAQMIEQQIQRNLDRMVGPSA
ncbi:MAG: hypothetical protein RIQ38_2580 [Pseudomonadota bacterium]|jgi:putative polyhydroxyalkanoate system protein